MCTMYSTPGEIGPQTRLTIGNPFPLALLYFLSPHTPVIRINHIAPHLPLSFKICIKDDLISWLLNAWDRVLTNSGFKVKNKHVGE